VTKKITIRALQGILTIPFIPLILLFLMLFLLVFTITWILSDGEADIGAEWHNLWTDRDPLTNLSYKTKW